MNLIGVYKNGNYDVSIFDDGTKIRENNSDFFEPSFPESMDAKITDFCNLNCPFCHENSSEKGLHGNILQSDFINTLRPFTEIALGGGNTISHPDLIPFLKKLKAKNVFASITVNQVHFEKNQELLSYLRDEELIRGLGVSVMRVSDNLISLLKKYPNAVLHVINGVVDLSNLAKLYNKNLKLLILGYKMFRRGKDYYSESVEKNKQLMYDNLGEILKRFSVVSFDNLAIKQLEVKRFLSDEEWNEFYMGDDGKYTMYIDMVKQEFAKSSTSTKRHGLLPNVVDMFNVVRCE